MEATCKLNILVCKGLFLENLMLVDIESSCNVDICLICEKESDFLIPKWPYAQCHMLVYIGMVTGYVIVVVFSIG